MPYLILLFAFSTFCSLASNSLVSGIYLKSNEQHEYPLLDTTNKSDYLLVANVPATRSVTHQPLKKVLFLTPLTNNEAFSHYSGPPCQAYAWPDWYRFSDKNRFCSIGKPLSFLVPDQHKLIARVEKYQPLLKKQVIYRTDFGLLHARPYQDLLFVTRPLALYPNAEKNNQTNVIAANSFVALIEQNEQWLNVEQVHADGSIHSGWINRCDWLGDIWVEQQAYHPDYHFRLLFDHSDKTSPLAIEVINRSNNQLEQIIYDFDSVLNMSQLDQALQVIDVNFDGHPDLVLYAHSGGAGPNSTHNIFLFNPDKQKFEWNETLSFLPQLGIDSEKQLIYTESRNSCCSHSGETYRFINGNLQLIEYWDKTVSPGGEGLIITTGHLIDGEMVHQEKKVPLPEDP